MRSISSGGQPWRVERVTLRETRGEMLCMNARSAGNIRSSTSRHSRKTGVAEASIISLR